MLTDIKGGIRTPSNLDRFQALAQRLSSVGEQVNITIDGRVIYGGGFRILNESRMSLSPFGKRWPRTQLLFIPQNIDAGSLKHILKFTHTTYEQASSRSVNRATRELIVSFPERGRLKPWGIRIQDEVPNEEVFIPHGKYEMMGRVDPVEGSSATLYLRQMGKFATAGDNIRLITKRAPRFVPIYSILTAA